jgi:hypothetical protein
MYLPFGFFTWFPTRPWGERSPLGFWPRFSDLALTQHLVKFWPEILVSPWCLFWNENNRAVTLIIGKDIWHSRKVQNPLTESGGGVSHHWTITMRTWGSTWPLKWSIMKQHWRNCGEPGRFRRFSHRPELICLQIKRSTSSAFRKTRMKWNLNEVQTLWKGDYCCDDDGWESIFGWLQPRASLATGMFYNFMGENWNLLLTELLAHWYDRFYSLNYLSHWYDQFSHWYDRFMG